MRPDTSQGARPPDEFGASPDVVDAFPDVEASAVTSAAGARDGFFVFLGVTSGVAVGCGGVTFGVWRGVTPGVGVGRGG
jgi:hypothetical protein